MTNVAALAAFETKSVKMEAMLLVTFQAPEEDAERILHHLTQSVPLTYGNYDSCAYRSAVGFEHYRPRAGAANGAEETVRVRPGVVVISFLIPRNQATLEEAVEQIFAVHSYEEPVITVQETLSSLSKGVSDKDNPHRWWNTAGDWMKQSSAAG